MTSMRFGLSNDKELEHFWSFVYYHGMLHEHFDTIQEPWEVPGDFVQSDVEQDSVANGEYKVEVEGKPATLYLGSYESYGFKNGSSGTHTFKSGFIVWDHDEPERHQEGRERMVRGY